MKFGTVRDADLLARARFKDGKKDSEVDLWLAARGSPDGEQPQREKRDLPGVVDADLRQKLLDGLHVRRNENAFTRWFAPIQEVSRSDTTLYISHPDPLADAVIRTNYADVVDETLLALSLGDCQVEFRSG